MGYSEYYQKDLAIHQTMQELQEKYQAAMGVCRKELSDLTNEYLGDFAVGKAVKYGSSKYYVEEISWIRDTYTTVMIRKARKDGNPNVNGATVYSVNTNDLEAWNEL